MAELWTQREDTGPNPGGVVGALVYDTDRSVAVLLAEPASSTHPGLTWEWDGTSWVQVDDMGPVTPCPLAFLPDQHACLGHTNTSQTWQRANGTWTQIADTGPSNVEVIAYDQSRSRCVALDSDTGHTWEWDGNAWTQVADSGPTSPRHGFGLAYDTKNKVTVLFGGTQGGTQLVNDTWTWDGKRWKQASDMGPSPRAFTAMTYDDTKARGLLFGGFDGNNPFGDTWQWDGKLWHQLSDMGPPPRTSPALCYDSQRQRTILYGGTPASDTWELFDQP
jgi:Galactose oxidase, central domain